MLRLLGRACLLLLSLYLVGCKEKPPAQLYFKDLLVPLGVGKVTVVSDVSLNSPSGGEVAVITTVEPEVDKDELNRLMNSFFRQVKDRRGFLGTDKVEKVDLRFYTTEAQAKVNGDNWLGRLEWNTGATEATATNKQKPPLLKWVKAALGKMPEYTGSLQPRILADPLVMSVELVIPFVSDDGSGKYVEDLTNVKAITEFVSYTRTLFEKIPELQKLVFIGRHNDEDVMKVWLDRPQYVALDLQQMEESLGAFQGKYIELIVAKQISEKAVEAKVIQQRRKVYREVLSKLPKAQVELAKHLQ
jgi:hypothetical protein